MGTSLTGTDITFNDATTWSSGVQACKAWVRFVGSPVSINSSYNVSGVVRTSTGNYTITFSSAFANANYTAVCSCNGSQGTNGAQIGQTGLSNTTTTLLVYNSVPNVTSIDPSIWCAAVYST